MEQRIPTLDAHFWEARYSEGSTGWDTGAVTTPLESYFSRLRNKSLRILIPGAGNAWEAEYLHRVGFTSVTVLDWAQAPLDHLAVRVPDFPRERMIRCDFFEHEGAYDLIVEQTFLCALPPVRRQDYARKMADLLVPGGLLAGLFFDDPLFDDRPPFGGSEPEYRGLLERHFEVLRIERARDSIAPRQGRELFFEVRKPA